jgi:hypothetical protein
MTAVAIGLHDHARRGNGDLSMQPQAKNDRQPDVDDHQRGGDAEIQWLQQDGFHAATGLPLAICRVW